MVKCLHCATCGACAQRCPQEVEIINIMRGLCQITVGLGVGRVPDLIRVTMKNISGVSNPAGEPLEPIEVKLSNRGIDAYVRSLKEKAKVLS